MSADLYTLTIPENMSMQDLLRAVSDLVAERGQLRSDLAAAIAARANMDTDRLEWMSRAEQAEARLAAIDSATVVASVGHGDYLHRHTANVPVGTLLIARPAKDSQSAFEETARSVGIRFDDIENHENQP